MHSVTGFVSIRSLSIYRTTLLTSALTYVHCLRVLHSREVTQRLCLLRCSESWLLITDGGTLDLGSLGGNLNWLFEGGRASLDSDALLFSTEATVLVGSDADGVLLGVALGVLSGSLSLGEVDSLEDGDGTLDGEGSVLSLDGESGVSSLSALAAVGLADLVVLNVGDGVEFGDLAGFSVLLVALGDTSTEAWELVELAWALNVERGEIEVANREVARADFTLGGKGGGNGSGDFDEVLDVLLAEAVLEASGGSSDDTSEESNEEDSHFDCLDVFV